MNTVRYSDRYFEGSVLSGETGRKAVRGVAVTLSSQSVKFVLQFGSIMILARLLTPEDFGLVAMVSVFVNFLNMFKDFGLSQAVIQSKEIKREQVSSLFWINVGICLSISMSMLAIAPLVANFYERRELVYVTMLLGAGIALQSVGLQHRALLIRSMQFVRVEIVELFAMFGALCVAISLALAGYSYWALVWQAVSQAFILSLGYVIACRWLPGRFTSFRECLHLLRFGGGLFSFNFVNYFSRNADNILVGKFLGAGPLGLYGKAYQLLRLPMQQVTTPLNKVALTSLSRLQQDPEGFRCCYLRFIRAATIINIPIIIYLGFFADTVVEVLLGEQWVSMVVVFQCLVPAALMGATNVAGSWAMVPLGRVAKQFYMALVSSVVHLCAMFVGLPWGVVGIAIAVSISRSTMKLPMLLLAYGDTEISVVDFLKIQCWPFVVSVSAAYFVHLCINEFLQDDSLAYIGVSFGLFSSIYGLAMLLDSELRSELVLLKRQLIEMQTAS